jgi:hypothetical protein
LEFDGTDDYVILGDVFDVTGSLTLMGWAYSTATDDENSIINKNGAPGSRDWALAGEFTNWLFRVSGDGATVADRYASVTVQLNSWVHVAGVYDATAQTMDIYINGQLRNGVQSNPIPASLNTTNNQVRIGSRQSTNQFFNGKLDDVRVYNYPLTTQQIRDDYNSGALYYGPATGIP